MTHILKEAGWAVVNALQALWLASFTVFCCFFLWMPMVICTGNLESSLTLARTFWGPINIRAGLSKVVVEGAEHVPLDRACVVLFNHQSMVDIAVAFTVLPVGVRFIAKRVLSFVPIVGWFMWALGMVSIDRKNVHAARAALLKAAGVLKDGHALIAFPEGTRSRDGTIGAFKKGAFAVAMQAGAPIVPAAIEGADVVAPPTGMRWRPNTIRVKIGAPIPTAGLREDQRDELMREVRARIIQLHKDIGGKGGDLEIGSGRVRRPAAAVEAIAT
jgi:1-acyl-sn-glycerol-3-phosphate acyltransferase